MHVGLPFQNASNMVLKGFGKWYKFTGVKKKKNHEEQNQSSYKSWKAGGQEASGLTETKLKPEGKAKQQPNCIYIWIHIRLKKKKNQQTWISGTWDIKTACPSPSPDGRELSLLTWTVAFLCVCVSVFQVSSKSLKIYNGINKNHNRRFKR